MSRLATLSPAALKAMYSQDSDDNLIVLLTISSTEISPSIRLADNYISRITVTDDDVVYGVVSRANNYIFLPFNITLPTEENEAAPRAAISISNVTRQLTPAIRSLTKPPNVLIELVLSSNPDVVEASFSGLVMAGITYNSDTISAELTVESLTIEPFPQHNFTPSYFPGLF